MVTFYEDCYLKCPQSHSPWRPQISYLVFHLVISSIYTAVVQACHLSPQVAHVCTIVESRLSAIFALADSARTCCCQGVIVIGWMSKGRVPPPTDLLPLFVIKLAHIQPQFIHRIGANRIILKFNVLIAVALCSGRSALTLLSILLFCTALLSNLVYVTAGTAFSDVLNCGTFRFTLAKKTVPERYGPFIFIPKGGGGYRAPANLKSKLKKKTLIL